LHSYKVIYPSLESSDPLEFFPTDGPEDGGKLFVHSSPLEHVHIVYMGVTKLSLVERLILLHLRGAMDGNVVAVRGHRNVVMCRIADQPPWSRAAKARRMKTMQNLAIHYWSMR
jgi:hypothetical protein